MSATFQSSHLLHQNPSSSISNSRSQPVPRSSSRNRSAPDPFLDDNNNHHHNRQKSKQSSLRPPDPPPKNPHTMSATTAAVSKQQIRDVDAAALRDTVTVSQPRKFSRSQTSATAPRPSQSSRQRAHSQDSVSQPAAAVERSKNKSSRTKKGSQHADIIDRLDFTGVGPMFHHDGPFDACAPSRNRHRTKAPMLAWSSTPNDPIVNIDPRYPEASPYPSLAKDTFSDNYYDVPKKKVDAIAEAWGIHEPEPFEDFSAGGGSGRPEGDTPNSSIYNGREGHSRTANGAAVPKRSKDGRDLREVYREYLDESIRPARTTNKRTPLPPPQPIFVPGPNHPDLIEGPASAPLSPPLTPKRNKSLMQRIRKMRDAPNVPVAPGGDYETVEPPSPSASNLESNGYPVAAPVRPTHRPQNSFLGRFGGGDRDRGGGGSGGGAGKGGPKENISPITDTFDRGKDLPATPQPKGYGSTTPTPLAEHESRGYFDEQHETSNGYSTSPGPGGIGRKTSMLKKVKGVVKGAK